jgi:arylsulfatase
MFGLRLGKGGKGTLFVNDKKVAEGRIEHTQGMVFSADETADVGVDDVTLVVEGMGGPQSRFTGKINKVTIELKEMKTSDKKAAENSHREAALKKGLSD